jgi:hypothetical protein
VSNLKLWANYSWARWKCCGRAGTLAGKRFRNSENAT